MMNIRHLEKPRLPTGLCLFAAFTVTMSNLCHWIIGSAASGLG